MTQVQNFPRERFTEMTDGNLSIKASVLGWPAGFFPEEFTLGRERFTRIAAERQPGSTAGEVTHWLFYRRACAIAASLTAEGAKGCPVLRRSRRGRELPR